MNHRIVLSILGMTLAATAGASVLGSPYNVIAARNPFGLRPAPVPVEKVPELPTAPPLPVIKITGITTLLGTAVVTFQYEDKETKKTEFPPLLREGERYKTLFVERIDVEKQLVVIRNGDDLATLDFVHNGVKPTAGAAMVASTPTHPPVFTASVPGVGTSDSSRVLIGNPSNPIPTTRPPLTPEQSRAQAELLRLKQLAEQQGRSASPAFPLPTGAMPKPVSHLR